MRKQARKGKRNKVLRVGNSEVPNMEELEASI